jgi:hypothetical protein
VTDAEALCASGIAKAVSDDDCKWRPTQAWVLPFSVVEEKTDEHGQPYLRRRPIAWPKSANGRMEFAGYDPSVDLRYFSHYRPAVRHEAATLRDLTAGFFQVECPQYARAQFRFRDATGRLYEMCRLPMGHTGAPEIMQTLTSVVAGDPTFCRTAESFAFTSPGSIAVWIDGIRFTGAMADVKAAAKFVDIRAKRFGVTFKATESKDAVLEYEFIGVNWNHKDHTVALSAKNMRRLQVDPAKCSMAELERFTSRLIWASSVHAVPLGCFYFNTKLVRRRLHRWEAAGCPEDMATDLPPSTLQGLVRWRQWVTGHTLVPAHKYAVAAVLFTDASLRGWGAVLEIDGVVSIAGGQWSDRQQCKSGDISALEGEAVQLAVETFADTLRRAPTNVLHLVVDNTSVEAALKRGTGRAERVNTHVVTAVMRLRELKSWKVYAQYIKSRLNPADPCSRGQEIDMTNTSVQAANVRLGGGEEARSRAFL